MPPSINPSQCCTEVVDCAGCSNAPRILNVSLGALNDTGSCFHCADISEQTFPVPFDAGDANSCSWATPTPVAVVCNQPVNITVSIENNGDGTMTVTVRLNLFFGIIIWSTTTPFDCSFSVNPIPYSPPDSGTPICTASGNVAIAPG